MPTYEYQCQGCRKRSETRQEITAKPLTKCAKCGGRLKRLMGSGGGLLFRGSGFYATDYRSAGYKASAKAEKSDKSEKSGGSSACSGSPSSCAKPDCPKS